MEALLDFHAPFGRHAVPIAGEEGSEARKRGDCKGDDRRTQEFSSFHFNHFP